MAVAIAVAAVVLYHSGSTAFCTAPRPLFLGAQIYRPVATAGYSSPSPFAAHGTESGKVMGGFLKGLSLIGLLCAVAVKRAASSSTRAAARAGVVLREVQVTVSSPAARAARPVEEYSLFAMDDELPTHVPPYSLAVVDVVHVPRRVRRKETKKAAKSKKARKQKQDRILRLSRTGFASEEGMPTKRPKSSAFGTTALMDASAAGSLAMMKDALKTSDVNSQDVFGLSALGYAVMFGQLKAAKVFSTCQPLIDSGADVNRATKAGKTPLMMTVSNLAASNITISMVFLLVYYGADPLVADNAGMNSLNHAARHGKDAAEIRKILNQSVSGTISVQRQVMEWLKLR